MDARTIYRSAMRCYRIAARQSKGGLGSEQGVAQFTAAVSLVRAVTGVWDIPHPAHRQQVCSGKLQRVQLWQHEFAVVPRFRFRDDGFGRQLEPVIYRPGKLNVWRSMTEFCRRTRNTSH